MSHQTISFVKSAVRIVGYLFLLGVPFFGNPVAAIVHAGAFLVVSEVLGVYEEVGQ